LECSGADGVNSGILVKCEAAEIIYKDRFSVIFEETHGRKTFAEKKRLRSLA
jgi:hypothetical protein